MNIQNSKIKILIFFIMSIHAIKCMNYNPRPIDKLAIAFLINEHMQEVSEENNCKRKYDETQNSQNFDVEKLRKISKSESGKRYACKFEGCNRRYKNLAGLYYHHKIHTGEKLFACEVEGCGKKFTKKSDLKDHTYTHSEKKSFMCESCRQLFKRLRSLNKHIKEIHHTVV